MHPYDNAEALLRVLREPRRNKYFYGKRMDVQHFQMEQDYGKLKQWLLNRLTLGKGVLCGLRVSASGGRVCVDPGVAIDGLGREIIVPLRYCIDPVVIEDSCCDAHRPTPTPTPQPTSTPAPTRTPQPTRQPGITPQPPHVVDGLFTLWLCYRECLTDHQPVLVSECGTRDECAAGTIVESFCLKFASGTPPPLGDPDWCAKLWDLGPADHDVPADVPADQREAFKAALASRRLALCELFDQNCDPAEGDPCVPLALVEIKDGQLTVDSCVVRPRIYSNQRLLDLILCLAGKIDECCGDHPPPAQPLKVRSIEFLRRSAAGTDTHVTSVQSPLQDTPVDINGKTNAIRIKFNRALATDQHRPTTHALNDPDFKLHNVQVLPEQPLNALPFVPGSLVLEAPDTVRFDLFKESPYARGADGWQKGRYRIFLRGDEHLAQNQQALAGNDGKPLDGEPIAPAGGVISGMAGPGGDFSAFFVVGVGPTPAPSPTPTPPPPTPTPPPPTQTPAPPPSLMHVRRIEFIGVQNQVLDAVKDPGKLVVLKDHLAAVRFNFDTAFAPSGARKPNVAGLIDPNFRTHNVQLRVLPPVADELATPFLAGKLTVEDARTFRVDLEHGTRLINADGRWRSNLRVDCEIFLRGTAETAGPELADANGLALDGEPKPPAAGVMSGDGSAGGDFTAKFTVLIPG
jgi:hypothetical protein